MPDPSSFVNTVVPMLIADVEFFFHGAEYNLYKTFLAMRFILIYILRV